MSQPLLEMRDIRKAFPGVLALDGVNLTVRRGEVHAVVGENGAGKSTLMKILSGVVPRDAGEILIDGQPVEITSPRVAQALGISESAVRVRLTRARALLRPRLGSFRP